MMDNNITQQFPKHRHTAPEGGTDSRPSAEIIGIGQGLCQIFANAQKTQILGNSKSLKRNDLQQIRLEQANHNINPKLFHVEQSAVSHQTPASPAPSHVAVKIAR
jgi:hypothetical protein